MMFKMLVFLIALEPVFLTLQLGAMCLSAGKISESLPFLALSLMSINYLISGASDTISYIKSRIK